MTHTSNLPGNIQHAPGVICYVVGDDEVPENNGKVVVLSRIVPNGSQYRCACGGDGIIRYPTPVWEVTGQGLHCNKITYFLGMETKRTKVPVPSTIFSQPQLIPISSPGTLAQLMKEELKPKDADKIQEWIRQVESTNS